MKHTSGRPCRDSQMKRPHPTIALLLWLTAAYTASFIGMQGTLRGLQGLYLTLAKPSWNPPAWLFAPVWTVLYALIGIAAWRVWRVEGKGLWLWWVQLVLNGLWPWLFFGFGKLGWAFGEIVVLWFAILATALVFARKDRTAAWLLVPYLAWVAFATVLNFAIWRMNRGDALQSARVSQGRPTNVHKAELERHERLESLATNAPS